MRQWKAATSGVCSLDECRAQLLEVVDGVPSEADLALLEPALDRGVGQAEQPRGCGGMCIDWMLSGVLGLVCNSAPH